ncbi:unnamed protein product [Lactuca saligna]|uniref:Uncharacterized protein n=1 Tax=Lactuca saligna TaxID=75948 RepID=A0AA35V4E0_LACSI|nr:unnamed protein product [Lactuca saligna]
MKQINPRREVNKTEPPAPKRRNSKKLAHNTKSPTPSESERLQFDTQLDVRNEEEPLVRNEEEPSVRNKEEPHIRNEDEEPIRNEDVTPNLEVTPTYNDFFPSPPSPKTTATSTPITIAPCPPPVSSQN